MEREINSTFYEKCYGISLIVVASKNNTCDGCFYDSDAVKCLDHDAISGFCSRGSRTDKKPVIFIKQTQP